MTSLNERIHRGEAAIARAKALGRDVAQWKIILSGSSEKLQKILLAPDQGDRINHSHIHLKMMPIFQFPLGASRTTMRRASRKTWGEIGWKQSPQRFTEHWGAIAKWLHTPPKTIRHMDKGELVALREDITAAYWLRRSARRAKGRKN